MALLGAPIAFAAIAIHRDHLPAEGIHPLDRQTTLVVPGQPLGSALDTLSDFDLRPGALPADAVVAWLMEHPGILLDLSRAVPPLPMLWERLQGLAAGVLHPLVARVHPAGDEGHALQAVRFGERRYPEVIIADAEGTDGPEELKAELREFLRRSLAEGTLAQENSVLVVGHYDRRSGLPIVAVRSGRSEGGTGADRAPAPAPADTPASFAAWTHRMRLATHVPGAAAPWALFDAAQAGDYVYVLPGEPLADAQALAFGRVEGEPGNRYVRFAANRNFTQLDRVTSLLRPPSLPFGHERLAPETRSPAELLVRRIQSMQPSLAYESRPWETVWGPDQNRLFSFLVSPLAPTDVQALGGFRGYVEHESGQVHAFEPAALLAAAQADGFPWSAVGSVVSRTPAWRAWHAQEAVARHAALEACFEVPVFDNVGAALRAARATGGTVYVADARHPRPGSPASIVGWGVRASDAYLPRMHRTRFLPREHAEAQAAGRGELRTMRQRFSQGVSLFAPHPEFRFLVSQAAPATVLQGCGLNPELPPLPGRRDLPPRYAAHLAGMSAVVRLGTLGLGERYPRYYAERRLAEDRAVLTRSDDESVRLDSLDDVTGLFPSEDPAAARLVRPVDLNLVPPDFPFFLRARDGLVCPPHHVVVALRSGHGDSHFHAPDGGPLSMADLATWIRAHLAAQEADLSRIGERDVTLYAHGTPLRRAALAEQALSLSARLGGARVWVGEGPTRVDEDGGFGVYDDFAQVHPDASLNEVQLDAAILMTVFQAPALRSTAL